MIKHYCDLCKKEIEKYSEFTLGVTEKEICEECFVKLKEFITETWKSN